MLQSATDPTSYSWSPVPPFGPPWAAGTYYWQVYHINCAAVASCDVTSPVGSFVIAPAPPVPPVPPPQPVTPADGATVQAGTTVYFTVYSALAGDTSTLIVFASSSGSAEIAPYGFSTDDHTSLFRVQLGDQPGSLAWTPARVDCSSSTGPSLNCPLVTGPTRQLNVVAPTATPPTTVPRPRRCQKGFTRAPIGGRIVCLHAGEFCTPPYAQQYRRHGYACVLIRGRYRLLQTCPSGSALAEIGGGRVCLRLGARCITVRARQYRRHGYACVVQKGKYRLVRRR
jgi:hypothetical protein